MTVMAWVLIVSSWNSNKNEVEQMGYYANKTSCIAVQESKPLRHFISECVRVKIFVK